MSIYQQYGSLLHTALLFALILIVFGSCDRPSICEDVNCNNGNCVIDTMGNASCKCWDNYTGDDCTIYDPCLTLSCSNGGTCTQDADGIAFCDCPDGFIGPNCQYVDPCSTLECLNGSPCIVAEDFSGYCDCPPGFIGVDCGTEDPCFGVECLENAYCYEGECFCQAGFEGADCENKVTDKFVGTYTVTTDCFPDSVYQCLVESVPTSITALTFSNLLQTGAGIDTFTINGYVDQADGESSTLEYNLGVFLTTDSVLVDGVYASYNVSSWLSSEDVQCPENLCSGYIDPETGVIKLAYRINTSQECVATLTP